MLLGAIWTFDHVVGLATLLVAIGTLAVGVVAAIYAVRNWRNQRDAATADAQRRRADIRPQVGVDVTRPEAVYQETTLADLTNSGGAAQAGFIVYAYGGHLYGSRFQLGAHTSRRITLKSAQDVSGTARTGLILLVARDVEGTWWNMRSGALLTDPPRDSSPEPFAEWAIRRAIATMRHDAGLADDTSAE